MWHAFERLEIHAEILVERPSGQRSIGRCNADVWIILKRILEKQGGNMWTGYIGFLKRRVCDD
jgi:hypothetical protein